MLRRLKMELKRDQEASRAAADFGLTEQSKLTSSIGVQRSEPLSLHREEAKQEEQSKAKAKTVTQKRVRGRRSSKPQMEKRRRARINECLDILKSYVLTNSPESVSQTNENRDEETIARRILESSGLINRHRGRKNPNKLEKADILELTVNYVRHLHQQRDQLMQNQTQFVSKVDSVPDVQASSHAHYQRQLLPPQPSFIIPPRGSLSSLSNASLTNQLSLNMSCLDSRSRMVAMLSQTPPTPPLSSNSSSPKPLLAISSNFNGKVNHQIAVPEAQVLDLTRKSSPMDTSNKLGSSSYHHSEPKFAHSNGLDLNCWRPWKLMNESRS